MQQNPESHQEDPRLAGLFSPETLAALMIWSQNHNTFVPGSEIGPFIGKVLEFEKLYRAGIIRVKFLSDQESQGLTQVDLKTTKEDNYAYLNLGLHPALALISAETIKKQMAQDEPNKAIEGLALGIVFTVDRYHQLKRAGVKFNFPR